MFNRNVTVALTKQEWVFTADRRESRFRPVVYLSPDLKKIIAVGSAPASDHVAIEVLADPSPPTSATGLIEALLRYGLRSVSTGFFQLPPKVTLQIGADLTAELKGFAPDIFRAAALHAGAREVQVIAE